MAAGDFTATTKAEILLQMERVWNDPRDKMVYEAEIGSVATIINQQTANIEPVKGTISKDNKVRVHWIDTQVLDGTDAIVADCEPDGTEIETLDEDYEITLSQQAENFKVKVDINMRDQEINAQDLVVKGLMKQVTELDRYVNKTVLAKLITFAGVNQLPDGYFEGWDVDSGDGSTFIDAENWSEDLFMELLLAAQFNKFSNVEFLHGRNYNVLSRQFQYDALNDNERDKAAKLGYFRHHFDPLTFNELDINDMTILLDRGPVAFASKNYNPDQPTERKSDHLVFTMPSSIPGLKYDVTKIRSCLAVSGVGEEIVDVYMMRVNFDLFLNPVIYTGNTGVLVLNKGDRPVVTTTTAP